MMNGTWRAVLVVDFFSLSLPDMFNQNNWVSGCLNNVSNIDGIMGKNQIYSPEYMAKVKLGLRIRITTS